MDRPSDGAEKAETLLQTPDARTREGIPLQRVRLQTEALGTGAEFDAHRTPGEDLVPEPTHEE